jgi:Ala-tRNA(Pro) deacylase
MLDAVVRHLHEKNVPFRLTSRPSEEPLPHLAVRVPDGGVLVETRIVRVGGSSVIACFPMGAQVDPASLGGALGEPVLGIASGELPKSLRSAKGPIPPLGTLFQLPLVLDQRISEARLIVFQAFSENDVFEIGWGDFARLEAPRIASFAVAGELSSRIGQPASPGR